jgi:hypothetical protein
VHSKLQILASPASGRAASHFSHTARISSMGGRYDGIGQPSAGTGHVGRDRGRLVRARGTRPR